MFELATLLFLLLLLLLLLRLQLLLLLLLRLLPVFDYVPAQAIVLCIPLDLIMPS